MKIYKCDGRIPATKQDFNIDKMCEKTTKDLFNWITIGTDSGEDLNIKNNNHHHKLIEMSSGHDLHFCSSSCLFHFFFLSDHEYQTESK